jgi:hypothetical protein
VPEAVEESAADAAGATVAVSVVDDDDLEPSLHAKVKLAIAAINNNFFMVFYFSFYSTQNYAN